MFDYKEITKRALELGEEMRQNKIRRGRRIKNTFIICASAAVAAAGLNLFVKRDDPAVLAQLYDERAPLADAYPFSDPETHGAPVFFIPCYGKVRAAAGAAETDMLLFNPESNPCFLTYAIELRETGERLYASDMIAPSKDFFAVKLLRTPEKGEHGAFLTIRAYETENLEIIKEVRTEFVISVE